ncbi:MAG TPA: hypothetical protein VE870_14555 [Bacteroidales bacterium]|nr:hypothetical protein [Bacteroidales bacterium]
MRTSLLIFVLFALFSGNTGIALGHRGNRTISVELSEIPGVITNWIFTVPGICIMIRTHCITGLTDLPN